MSKKFLDEIQITVKSGNGGPGCVSFNREKYVPLGSPDGGDGGNGGHVVLSAKNNILSLSHLNPNKKIEAQNGRPGGRQNKSGKKGNDIHIRIPLGTQLINPQDNSVLHDFIDESPFLLEKGGRGGKGNAFFKSSVKQAPDYAQPGESTQEKIYLLKLKLIADIGMVGLPNAGKSTLLKALTGAHPKIGSYPFTTLQPNLGVLYHDQKGKMVIADIPGILKGASKGYGLGLSFLKHIERVKILLYVLDIEKDDPKETIQLLQTELSQYNDKLTERPCLVALNKIDLIHDEDFREKWKNFIIKDIKLNTIFISAYKNEGIDDLRERLFAMVS